MEEIASRETSPRLLLGSGRSGTTWIQDCLADANDLRPIFEPLHPGESAVGSRCAFDVRTRDANDEELEQLFRNPDSGVVSLRWTAHRTPGGLIYPRPAKFRDREFMRRSVKAWRKYITRMRTNKAKLSRNGLIYKCIRANLMIDWFANALNFTVALIVRHPCAVVESQHRLGRNWDPRRNIERYRRNLKLHELTNGKFETLLNGNLSSIEALSLNWVIENQWPLENQVNGNYFVMHYEDFLNRPSESWEKLCSKMNLKCVPSQELTQKPSQQSYRERPDGSVDAAIPHWKRSLSANQLSDIQGILDKTNFHVYSVENPCPL